MSPWALSHGERNTQLNGKVLLRRVVLLGGAAFLVAFEPVPVKLEIENDSAEQILARLGAEDPWTAVPAGETVTLVRFSHAGLCRPPARWLPESFTGLDRLRADGEQSRVDRSTFEESAVWGRGETWTFTVR